MHVLLVAENWPPRQGGIENYVSQIASHLPQGSVSVVAPKSSDANDTSESRNYELFRRRFFWPFLKPAWLPLYLFTKRLHRKREVNIIIAGKALFEGLLALAMYKKFGIPYIVLTYAMEIETWARVPRQRRQLIRVLTSASRVVYINDVTKKRLHELGVTDKQLVKIWPGADDRFFVPIEPSEKKRILEKYNLRSPYVLSVARLIPRKGLDVLLEAFATLDQLTFSDVSLVFVGAGPLEAELKELALQHLIGPRVHFLPDVPDEDLPALYAGAHIFALTPRELPTDFEGFGIVYIEAAAVGVPAIGTKTGGVPEALVHQETGLVVEPDSPAAVSKALDFLLRNPEEREAMGQRAKERAYQEFRWRKRILLVKGMIDAVLSAPRNSAS